MKNRLLATVLTLALLCPMLSFFTVLDTSAALEVDDGVTSASSGMLYEDWNFDDMTEGEILTDGYINSHAHGDFGGLSKIVESFGTPEKWVAVSDTENGGAYIRAENGFIGFEDDAKLLLKGTYEISWRMKVENCSADTTLLWWSDGETTSSRRVLFRLASNGTVGYTTSDTYSVGQTFTSTKIQIGENAPWYSFRARINPIDGRMWLWINGDIVIDGIVNNYLRDNGRTAEYSRIGIMYTWSNQSMIVNLDDVKLNPVQIDEYIDFETDAEVIVPIDELLDFEDLAVDSSVSANVLNNGLVGGGFEFSLDGDGGITAVVDPKDSTNKAIYNTNKRIYFDFLESFDNYSELEISFDVMFEGMGGHTSFFSPYVGAEAKPFLRIHNDSSEIRDNGENKIANLVQGADAKWYTMVIKVEPATGAVDYKVTERDSGAAVGSKAWTVAAFKTVCDNGDALKLRLHYSWNSSFKSYFDNIAVNATPTADKIIPVDASWNLDDGILDTKDGVTVTAGSGYDINTIDGDTVNTSKALRVMKAESSSTVTGPKFTLSGTVYSYETVTVSYKMKFNYSSNYTNVFRFVKADGGVQNLFRVTSVKNPSAETPAPTADVRLMANDGIIAGKITGGVWSNITVTIKPISNNITINIDGKETKLDGNSTFASIFKALDEGGMPLSFMLYYHTGMKAEVYFDDISIKATLAPINAEKIVDNFWKESTFDMTVSPDVGDMANDDWTIATDPKLVAPSGIWNFNNSNIAAQNGITVDQGSNCEFVTVSGDSNTSVVLATKSTHGNRATPLHSLPGSIRDYETITVSFKIKYGADKRATNYTNLFRYINANGEYSVIGRVPSFTSTDTCEISYRTTATGGGGGSGMKINVGEWNDITFVITPATGGVVLGVNGATKSFTNSAIKALYDDDKTFSFMTYYHVNMVAEVYFDDIEIKTQYSEDYKDSLGYGDNDVLKTVTDDAGNTRGIFAIEDKEAYLANQPFEISFDYMMNQKPSGWLNLVKMKMTATVFTVFRLDTQGNVCTYTYSGMNMSPNVNAKKLEAGCWYNIRVVLDPATGHIMGYIDNELICDYNINDVYVDASGVPLGVTQNPDRMFIELASQYSASAIKINDSSIDNLRIRTLPYSDYRKTFLTDSDFNGTTAGDLDASTFAKVTGLYSKSLGGKFTVDGATDAKYVNATVKAGEGVALDMTNGYGLLTNETVAFEGNFKFSTFGSNGMLNLYSLKRGDGTAVSLLSVDGEGKLFLGQLDTGKTVAAGELYQIKLIYSGAFSTAELFVDNTFIAAAKYDIEVPVLAGINDNKFGFVESDTVKTLSGVKLQSAVISDPYGCAFPEDTLYFLSVDGDGTWNVVFDDLAIYKDERANLGFGNIYDDVNSKLWGNSFVVDFAYGQSSASATDLVSWNFGDSTVALLKENGGKLYAADGTTELATLGADSKIALVVSTNHWEHSSKDENYTVNAVAYVDGSVVGSYKAASLTQISAGKLQLADGANGAVIYFGNSFRTNRIPADASGVKFDGYNAFSTDFEDAMFFEIAETNAINYVEWSYPDLGSTVEDLEGAKVTLAEHIVEADNSFFRLRRPELSNKPVAYMEYNLGAMGEFVGLYSVQMELKYTDNLSSSLNIATLYDENMSGELNLLSVDYEGKLYFINNGIRYYLCDNAKNPLTVNKVSDETFTKVAIVVNDREGSYSIWIDGQNAWYYADGQESGSAAPTKAIPLNFVRVESYSVCDAKIRLLEASNNNTSDSVIDIDNISIDIIKAGYAPVNSAFQTSELGDDIRFIATVDTLYTNEVGFEIEATSNIDGTKVYSDSANVVFGSVEAAGETVLAETLGGRYISVLTIKDLKVAEYSFKVRPFVTVFGEKIYGDETVYTYNFTTSVE